MCLSNKNPIAKRSSIPGRAFSLESGSISPSIKSQSILPASCASSCLRLMIWSSRARNRSPDIVVACFFGRIVPSDALKESCFASQGNPENEIASFQGLNPPKPCNLKPARSPKNHSQSMVYPLFTDDSPLLLDDLDDLHVR